MNSFIKSKTGGYFIGKKHKTIVSVLTGCTSKKDLVKQLEKLDAIMSLEQFYQPEIISDLSLYSSKAFLYKEIINRFDNAVVSTLPIYQVNNVNEKVEKKELLDTIEEQCQAGVGFITIHPTPTVRLIELATKRYVPITSRGGAIVIKDLIRQQKNENVYIEILDEIIKICLKYKVAISIGASFRSANIFDSLDQCQIEEFSIQKDLANYIYSRGVDIIVEGPGHSKLSTLKDISNYYKEIGFPIMPLGPIPTDISIGQDHISSAIGASVLGMFGCVDIVTSVTREEHTGKIPSIGSSIEAIKASKIAAHIINIDKVNLISKDQEIVENRMINKTCIYNKNTAGCSRCAHVCPLKLTLD